VAFWDPPSGSKIGDVLLCMYGITESGAKGRLFPNCCLCDFYASFRMQASTTDRTRASCRRRVSQQQQQQRQQPAEDVITGRWRRLCLLEVQFRLHRRRPRRTAQRRCIIRWFVWRVGTVDCLYRSPTFRWLRKTLKERIAVHETSLIIELPATWDHTVTCHPTQVNAPRLNPSQ